MLKNAYRYDTHFFNYFKASRERGDWCDFRPCDGNRAVSVLAVRDPEGVLVVRAEGAPIYALVKYYV